MGSMAAHAMGCFGFRLLFVQMELKTSISSCLNSQASEISFKIYIMHLKFIINFCYFHSPLKEFQLSGSLQILHCNKINWKKQIEITHVLDSRDLSLSHSGPLSHSRLPSLRVLSCESVCLHCLSSRLYAEGVPGMASHHVSWANYFKIMQFFTRHWVYTPNFGLKIRIKIHTPLLKIKTQKCVPLRAMNM